MIVGFTLLGGNKKEIANFIRKYCILESPEIADNIAALGKEINVFSKGLDESSFLGATFSYTPIETVEGKIIVASAVDFNLEVTYNGKTKFTGHFKKAITIYTNGVPETTRIYIEGTMTEVNPDKK